MSAQEQIRKLLINDFAFKLISTKETGFGERLRLRCDEGLEAQLGVYRICFYAAELPQIAEGKTFPTTRQPLCFDTDHRSEIKLFLEKAVGIKIQPKKRIARKSSAPTLFEI